MTSNRGPDPADGPVELHAETVGDLDVVGDAAGGLRPAGGFTDLECTEYVGCNTDACSELCEP